ncbi:MAG: hypothetical protein QNK19_14070 [Xanthomonadales bacterium]|nr:hypothetical protein [Xanthomonadales bacterium]
MKLLKNVINLAIATAAIVSFSFAQASIITTTSDSVSAGSPATIHLDWNDEGAGDYRSVAADLQFNNLVLTSFNLDDCPATGYTTSDGYFAANCTDQGGGVIRTGWALISGGVPTGRLGTIVFQTDPSATPGDYDISFMTVTVDQAAPTEVVGTVTILAAPEPDWSSTPDSATGFDFGSHTTDTGTYPLDLAVTNAGADGSTLTGTCDVTGSAVFSIPGDNTLGTGLAAGASANITVQCDTTSAAVQLHTGTMSCTHNGDGTTETSITDYALNCNVTATPEPSFLGVDSGLSAMNVVEQGDPDATATLTVSNNGEVGTTLIGSCVYAGATEIAVTNGTFSLAQGGPGQDVLATCSGAAEGTYTGTLTCGPTAPQTWVAADSPYTVSCTVGPPGAAVYDSNPAAGSTIDMTPPGSPVEEGSVIPTQDLVITNNAPETDDSDLVLLACGLSGMGAITATTPTTPLAPNASTTVTFSCDSTTAGDYTETYNCPYDVDGDGTVDGTASYTVNCGVRLAEADVTQTPPAGSTLTITVVPGGTGQTSVTFQESNDEGLDGSLESCSLADETYFSILSPTSFPQVIPSGGSLQVVVEGRALDDGEPASTTLTCTYSDSNVTDQVVTWTVAAVTRDIPIPTLSAWGLSLMILTLLGLGGIVIRRRVSI